MARNKVVEVAEHAEEVAPRRSGRKRKDVSYKEPKETEVEWIEEPLNKKAKNVSKGTKAKAAIISRDDEEVKEDDDEEIEIVSVITEKRAEKQMLSPKPPPKKSKKRTGGVRYDDGGTEVRQRDYQPEPSDKFLAAKNRALTHPIHFIDRARCDSDISPEERFTIMGTSGSNYEVHVKHIPKCTCMDSIMRGRQYHCKHIIYVYVNVLKVRDELAYQMALTSEELNEIFDAAPANPIERAIIEIVDDPNRKPIEGECPICYMEFEPEQEAIVYCKAACGNNIHKTCMTSWISTKQRERRDPTCPYCRERWVAG